MSNVNCEAHLGAAYEINDFQNKTRIKAFPPDSYYELHNSDSI